MQVCVVKTWDTQVIIPGAESSLSAFPGLPWELWRGKLGVEVREDMELVLGKARVALWRTVIPGIGERLQIISRIARYVYRTWGVRVTLEWRFVDELLTVANTWEVLLRKVNVDVATHCASQAVVELDRVVHEMEVMECTLKSVSQAQLSAELVRRVQRTSRKPVVRATYWDVIRSLVMTGAKPPGEWVARWPMIMAMGAPSTDQAVGVASWRMVNLEEAAPGFARELLQVGNGAV
jgi:hypothetical protein